MSNQIAFLGTGSMNGAIMGGLLAAGFPKTDIVATVRRRESASELAERYGVTVMAWDEESDSNAQAARGASIVVIGVKPVGVAAVAREIAPVLSPGAVVVSVAAAVSIEQLERELPEGQPVIRTMPNTPSRLGKGVVALARGTHATTEQVEHIKKLFGGLGLVVEVSEDQIAAVSAVSGSGPAYAFYLAEAMAKAGESLGLEPRLALQLARETVVGAGYMLDEPGADPAALRRAVTSPKGTTEQAIRVFDERGLPGIIADGARAAVERSDEITRELGRAPRV
ncbi:Pyrroline-5-carboxylate reductase [Sinomonas atrocyanea]|uniref:Pyrroline-5-carboxylate reductase n=1 Tax=Sinomonas atrocyanea TaxID=37927 RepID=A0A127A3Q6_9MICC|nr:pyrroline-5-carboxylate reductase [Sinomonas atrocyanea]AMM33943.1 Pyrroline-5-carboxylate reductase [Sinomonas atrocyanea]GEB63437.1 pyrroline-5-carboxylate reductase [Sinomonas atrocyanea]GGG72963.1 pyrroline-5-carboxylate reductase [Sinomonas atrocyanea]